MELSQKLGFSIMAFTVATAVLATLGIHFGLSLLGLEIGGAGDR